MAIRDWFRRAAPPEEPTATAELNAHVTSWGDVGWTGVGSTSRAEAMCVATVYACVRKLAEQVASFPVVVVQRTDDQGRPRRIKMPDHPVSRLLRRPNTLQSGYEFFELMVSWLSLHGVAYAEIIRDRAGRVIRLWPIEPSLVTVERGRPSGGDMSLTYQIQTVDGTTRTLRTGDVVHLRGLYSDLVTPVSPIAYQASVIATQGALYGHEYSTFAANGVAAGGTLELGPRTSEADGKALLRAFNSKGAGPANAARWFVTPHGVKAEALKIDNADAQLLQLLGFGRTDICTVFGVPPELIGLNENSKYASAQAAGQFFVATTLRPLVERIEAALHRDLMPGSPNLDIHFDSSALLRGSPAEETAMHVQRVQGGIETPNEARIAVGHDIVEESGADQLYIQMNQTPVDQVGDEPSEDEPDDDDTTVDPDEAQELAARAIARLASVGA